MTDEIKSRVVVIDEVSTEEKKEDKEFEESLKPQLDPNVLAMLKSKKQSKEGGER